MKLLLDENLSRRIAPFLQSAFPESTQVALIGLEQADDRAIWQYAQDHGYIIVTRDSDFHERSMVLGHPPQVIWLKIPNCTKSVIINLLLDQFAEIERVLIHENLACIQISMGHKA